MSTRRKHPIRWLYRLIAAIAFFALGGILVASANGYQFNVQSHSFEPTGVIVLKVDQLPETVTVNDDQKEAKRGTIKFANLFPGYYTVDVAKDGYFTWSKSEYLSPGQAISHPFVKLFLKNPTVTPGTEKDDKDLKAFSLDPQTDDQLDQRGNELWVKPVLGTYPIVTVSNEFVLIARYGQSLGQVIWYPGRTHIVAQIGNEIRILDRDGSNDTVLATLSNDDVTQFMIADGGKTLVYRDSDKLLRRPLIEQK